MKNTKMLAVASLMAAMCVAILSIGSLFESLDVSLAIAAGLVVMILSVEYGDRVALSVFLVSGLLSLLLPLKSPSIFFLCLVGWYPIVQKKIHMLKPLWARIVKFVLFHAALFVMLFLSAFITGVKEVGWVYLTLLVLGNLCFFLYDLLLDRFLIWYIVKLRPRLKF